MSNGKKQSAAAPAPSTESTGAVKAAAIVILAFPGTEEKMRRLWAKALEQDPDSLQVETFTPEESSLSSILTEILLDDSVAEQFTLVPANTFPPKRLAAGEVSTPMVYVSGKGERSFCYCLPMQFDKTLLVDDLAGEDRTNDDICSRFSTEKGIVPVEAGYTFGNIILPVPRANPCRNRVIEGFIRRKYVAATIPEAWAAIEDLVDNLLDGPKA